MQIVCNVFHFELHSILLKNQLINIYGFFFSFQQQSKSDKIKQVTSPEDCDDLSPMPHVQVPPVRRRGGISAEPVSEEDATSYVKKVVSSIPKWLLLLFHT